jgi:hypothetical protein
MPEQAKFLIAGLSYIFSPACFPVQTYLVEVVVVVAEGLFRVRGSFRK